MATQQPEAPVSGAQFRAARRWAEISVEVAAKQLDTSRSTLERREREESVPLSWVAVALHVWRIPEAVLYAVSGEDQALREQMKALAAAVEEIRVEVRQPPKTGDPGPEISAGLRRAAAAREAVQDPPTDIRDHGERRKTKGDGPAGH